MDKGAILNAAAVVWFVVVVSGFLKTLLSKDISLCSRIARNGFMLQILFSIAGVVVNLFNRIYNDAWIWGASTVMLLLMVVIAKHRHRKFLLMLSR